MKLGPTIDIADALGRRWDAVVIGAGPAGSLAARELARKGRAVLLVDKVRLPRFKVCGCCLNSAALSVLSRAGLGAVPSRLGARPLERVELVSHRGRRANMALSGGVSVSRWALDEALVREAIAAGCAWLPGCVATVGEIAGDERVVYVGGNDTPLRSGIVIAADGLAGTSLSGIGGFGPEIARRSRIGIGATMDAAALPVMRGSILMVCGRSGYVGAVEVEDGRIDTAAAIDPVWIKELGGPGPAVASILASAGVAADRSLADAAWKGTPPLTRRRAVEAERLLVIGDAAGYVEPFTGEGMAWALAGAEKVAALVIRGYVPGAWRRAHRAMIGARQRECRWIARLLRHSTLSSVVIALVSAFPGLAAPIVRRTGGVGSLESGYPREVAAS